MTISKNKILSHCPTPIKNQTDSYSLIKIFISKAPLTIKRFICMRRVPKMKILISQPKVHCLSLKIFYLFLLFCSFQAVSLHSTDIRARLNSHDGSTSFQVRDSAEVTVGRIDSDGHMLLTGSATVTNGFIVASSNTGLGTSNPLARVHIFSAAGTDGPQLLVSTGTTNLLEVNGSSIVVAVDIYRSTSSTAYNFPDYVFEPNYKMLTFEELRSFLQENKHLPNVPSVEQVKKEGVKIFEQNRLLLEKLEEAYLYILQIEKRYQKLQHQTLRLKSQIKKISKK